MGRHPRVWRLRLARRPRRFGHCIQEKQLAPAATAQARHAPRQRSSAVRLSMVRRIGPRTRLPMGASTTTTPRQPCQHGRSLRRAERSFQRQGAPRCASFSGGEVWWASALRFKRVRMACVHARTGVPACGLFGSSRDRVGGGDEGLGGGRGTDRAARGHGRGGVAHT